MREVVSGGTIDTLAGTGVAGFSGDNGPANAARLDQPGDVAIDAAGNVYIADLNNSRVRRVAVDGTITTFAGTGVSGLSGDNGPATAARLANPVGLDLDAAGNLYVADFDNHTVRKITPGGTISRVAGTGTQGYSGDNGPATAARMSSPADVAVDGAGNVFIAEFNGHRVRKVSPGGTITTVAGTGTQGYSGTDGPATAAQMSSPAGVDVDSSGNLFVAEFGNHVIREVDAAGTITRVAGVALAGFAGDGGPATSAQIDSPSRVSLSPDGDFYVSDWGNHRVRHVDALGSPDAPTLTSTSPGSPASSNSPSVIGSSETGFTVRLYTDPTCTSAVAATGTAAQLASPGLSVTVPDDSTTTFWATATDSVGSVSGCSTSSITYVEDSTAPPAPSIDSPPASPDNDTTPTWTFSGEAGATFECRLERGATVIYDWASCPSPGTFDLSAETDGTYTFSVRQTDAAGNTSSAASDDYELDTAAPAAPAIGTDPGAVDSDATPTWGFSGEAGATFECRLTRAATVVFDWASCSSPRTYDLAAEPDGTYTFSVRQTDAAGNTGAAQTHDYALDRGVPAAPSIDSSPPSPDNSTAPSWSFSGEAGATFECRLRRLDGSTVSGWSGCTSPQSYSLAAELDGAYEFSVRQTDAAGNSSASADSWYVLDTTPGLAPAIDSAPPSPDSDTSPTWAFSGEPGATFECRLERGATVVVGWAGCSSPWAFDLSGEPDGAYTFSVRQIDGPGNVSRGGHGRLHARLPGAGRPQHRLRGRLAGQRHQPHVHLLGRAGRLVRMPARGRIRAAGARPRLGGMRVPGEL